MRKANLVFYLKLGFFVGLGIGLLLTPLSTVERINEGMTETDTRSLTEYGLIVLRWAFATSFVSGFISFIFGEFLE